MALNWTAVSGSFNDQIYDVLLNLEAPLAADRLNGRVVGSNFTIGIGFDLVEGKLPVQKAVFVGLGLNATPLDSPRPADGSPGRKEYDFLQELVAALNGHQGATELNAIMARRFTAAEADAVYKASCQRRREALSPSRVRVRYEEPSTHSGSAPTARRCSQSFLN